MILKLVLSKSYCGSLMVGSNGKEDGLVVLDRGKEKVSNPLLEDSEQYYFLYDKILELFDFFFFKLLLIFIRESEWK